MKINLDFIPKKYRERINRIEAENGLIDDCKYMLYLNDGWEFWEKGMQSTPVKSKKEVLYFIKNETYKIIETEKEEKNVDNKANVYQIYDTVKYNGYEWIVINVKNDKLTLMMRNCLSTKKMKEIFNKDYLDYVGDIKYSLDEKCNDWNKTEIKRGLNNEFLKEFKKEELVEMKTNYDENKYSFDYIRIPTVREIEGLGQSRVAPDKLCWTMSPSYFNATNYFAREWIQSDAGYLSPWWYAAGRAGIRPIITVEIDNANVRKD